MRKKRRCYLSGAVTGTTEYMERFEKYEKYLTQVGWVVINPVKVNAGMPTDTLYEEYMEMSETMLKMCDRIFLMKGWEKSKGAKYEREYAIIHNMKVFYEDEKGEMYLLPKEKSEKISLEEESDE